MTASLAPAHIPPAFPPPAPAATPRLAAVPDDLTVAVMTPWRQQCGNAEFMKRLAAGLERFARIIPVEMQNIGAVGRGKGGRELDRYFLELVAGVNASGADVVHIQHEFVFFGRRIAEANRRFHAVMRQLQKPVVVSLHTWLGRMSRPSHRRPVSRAIWNLVHPIRDRHASAALRRASAIVLHSHETNRLFAETYPELRARAHVLPFPIERARIETGETPLRKSPTDIWLMLPGFVSRYKGHLHVLEALRHLPEHVKLVAAGGVHPQDQRGSDYWMELLQRADSLGLHSRLFFTGYLATAAEQAAVLAQADAFVLPYEEIGQSGSAVLADVLSYDRPVITSRARSMFVYRMDPQTAFSSRAVDVTNAEAFAAAIRDSLAEVSAGAAGHRSAVMARYSMASTQASYEQLYRQVLKDRRA